MQWFILRERDSYREEDVVDGELDVVRVIVVGVGLGLGLPERESD